MITVVEPGRNISKLWGKQAPKSAEKYRLLHYVILLQHMGRTAIHNNVTGQLVILDEVEEKALAKLPAGYSSELKSLIEDHFLVPVDYNEHQQVDNLRRVLKKLMPVSNTITNYMILPTTACNARCYYCFEQGSPIMTMSEETALDVVKFIADNCGKEKKVFITWFGGEPTVAANRIDRICVGLQAEGISYNSMMYTNGYLFDEMMAARAKELWHLNHVQMSVDGTETLYNKIKSYVNADESPFKTVLQNIGYMLSRTISVAVRMNVDSVNHMEFAGLMSELNGRYKGNQLLCFSAYPLIGEYADHDGIVKHADEQWIAARVEALNVTAVKEGFMLPTGKLPQLTLNACMADSPSSITIGADGNLVKCGEHYLSSDKIGTLKDGITDARRVSEWEKTYLDEKCIDCPFYPNCMQLKKCSGAGHCYRQGKKQQYVLNIKYVMGEYLSKGGD